MSRTVSLKPESWRSTSARAGILASATLLVGAAAGAKCASNSLSNPGWETDFVLLGTFAAGIGLFWFHRATPRRQWMRMTPLEVAALWFPMGAGYDLAQHLFEAQLFQRLILASITAFLITLLALWGTLVAVQAIWRPVASSACRSCGYSADGLTTNVCPECGAPVMSVTLDTAMRRQSSGRESTG